MQSSCFRTCLYISQSPEYVHAADGSQTPASSHSLLAMITPHSSTETHTPTSPMLRRICILPPIPPPFTVHRVRTVEVQRAPNYLGRSKRWPPYTMYMEAARSRPSLHGAIRMFGRGNWTIALSVQFSTLSRKDTENHIESLYFAPNQ